MEDQEPPGPAATKQVQQPGGGMKQARKEKGPAHEGRPLSNTKTSDVYHSKRIPTWP
jgi:hypothetical protein